MEIEFQHQNIVLRACMVIPVWFILSPVEYYLWGDAVNAFLFVLISVVIMVCLSPVLFKIVYRIFPFLIFRTSKVRFSDESIIFILRNKTITMAKRAIMNASYEQISLYGAKMDKIIIEYTIRGGHKALSLFSPDIVDGGRDRAFVQISRKLAPIADKIKGAG